jgi:hypothetical protein
MSSIWHIEFKLRDEWIATSPAYRDLAEAHHDLVEVQRRSPNMNYQVAEYVRKEPQA